MRSVISRISYALEIDDANPIGRIEGIQVMTKIGRYMNGVPS